jgi:DNA-binding response OmpR family regulator
MPTSKTAADCVLVVSASLAGTTALYQILEQSSSPIAVLHSASCHQALGYLQDSHISAVLCEALLPDGNWKDLLAFLENAELPPSLVVTSKVADESLWAEVLNLGGYDVLAQPFDNEEVHRVVRSAVRASSDQLRRRVA